MKRPIFSQSWHHVAPLRPHLLPQARIYRHTYRGQLWYIVQDSAGNRYHRLTPAAYALVSRMDGARTIQSLWDDACRIGGDELPTQDDIVELLMQLHAQDLLHSDVTPDTAELFDRYRKRRSQKWKQWLKNPLSLRIPVLDPDLFLSHWVHRLAWIFSRKGAVLWLAVVAPALLLAGQHWSELTHNLSDQVLATDNLLLLILVFPLIKALHELGHGFATKVWGGTVHEMGVMFLVFAPVPYVDASSSSTFQSKRQRTVVGAAGMLVELFVAALAMYIWVLVEPGLLRSIVFNVMFIAGVSTLIVNGNPLLRFDGYYILADLIEIPNLAQRGQRYLKYLSDRHLFGARDQEPPDETNSEKRWLAVYTVSSWVYRVLLTITIILFVANEFFIFGVLLAVWGAVTLFGMPVWKSLKHVLDSPTLHRHRPRAIKVSLGLLAGVLLFVGLIPMPLRTLAQGVVWLPDQALVRSGVDGTFERWLVAPGTAVQRGTALLVMRDPALSAELAAARARVAEANARYRAEQFSNPVQGEVTRQKLEHEKRTLERIEERHARLVIHSETDGVLAALRSQDLEGQYFRKGELIGYILDQQQFIARVAISQDDIDLVQSRLKDAELRFADSMADTHPVAVIRQTPSGIDELPTAALSPAGGGPIAVDPKDPNGLKTLQRIFLVDLKLPVGVNPSAFGGRVYVRFRHMNEPLLSQWMRRIRQLFLSHFHV
jgi:putative peptide zinc metalloprotease protein